MHETPVQFLGREDPLGRGIGYPLQYSWASCVAQLVKNLPAMRETWIRSLGWEDPLAKEKVTYTSIWSGEFHGLSSPWGCFESDMTERLSLHLMADDVAHLLRCLLAGHLYILFWGRNVY